MLSISRPITTVPVTQKNIASMLQEIVGMKNVAFKGTEMYVFRFNELNELRNSKPCNDCVRMIKKTDISRVCYSVNNGVVYESVSNLEGEYTTRSRLRIK
jgi:hypothetical protein